MTPRDDIRRWWVGSDDAVTEPETVTPAPDEEDVDPADLCPMGGEHDIQEIGAATNQGKPLFTYCRRCREAL
jgi:hypothetical protein